MAGIQIKFCVPSFPEFKYNLSPVDLRRHSSHMDSFMKYAMAGIAAQVKVAELCVEKGGFAAQKVEIENLVKDVRFSIDALAEKSAICIGEELSGLVSEVGGLKRTVEETVVSRVSVTPGVASVGVPKPTVCDNPKTLLNRQRRFKKRELKLARQAGMNRSDWRSRSGAAPSVPTPEEEEKKAAALRLEIEKINKQTAKIKKEMVDGTFEKEMLAKQRLLDGQIEGRYSFVAPERVVGFAKTLISATSKSNSTGAAKTVWSGSGASKNTKFSSVSADSVPRVRKTDLEAFQEREIGELKKEIRELRDQIPVPKGYQGDWS